ncbi:hypothetical protein ACP70R_005674 [Stipagrostis hirtigluma subsp. patula]
MGVRPGPGAFASRMAGSEPDPNHEWLPAGMDPKSPYLLKVHHHVIP